MTSSLLATWLCLSSLVVCLLVLQDTSHFFLILLLFVCSEISWTKYVCDYKEAANTDGHWPTATVSFPSLGMNREQVTKRLCGPRREDRDVADVVQRRCRD